MEELLRLLAESYRTSTAQPFASWPPGVPSPGWPPGMPSTPAAWPPGPAARPANGSVPPAPGGPAPAGGYPHSPSGAPWPPTLPGAPPLPSLFDWIRLQALIYEEGQRIQSILFERLVAPAIRNAAQPPRPAAGNGASANGAPANGAAESPTPSAAGGEEIVELLRRAQLLLLRYPIAAQAAFSALVAEGRRFAGTPEGAQWKEALASSDLLHDGRRVWDAVSLNMLEDDPHTIIPSAYLEALLRAAKSADLDGLIKALQDPAPGGDRAPAR